MANIANNDQYQSAGPTMPKSSYRYTPSSTYQNLAQLKASGSSPFSPASPAIPGTPQHTMAKNAGISQYGRLLNDGMGVETGRSFLPFEGTFKDKIAIPSDYGQFMSPMTINNNGEKLSWGTPEKPVIRTLPGDAPGQFVEDLADPNKLVKTIRGNNSIADQAIRNGRPGFMYQIDHIMPLSLGGADTLANRQLLTYDQNDKKTRAQAIPYTLYAHGDISLADARSMAMQWKDRDLTDIPQPNEIGLVSDMEGKSGIEIAREARDRWSKPKPVGFKEVMAEIPNATKNLGEGYLPDSVREFIKGFGSAATLGFLPYEQDDDEGKAAWLTGKIGQVAGTAASFMLGYGLVNTALRGVGMTRGALTAYKGLSSAKALANGFKAAEGASALAEGGALAEGAAGLSNVAPKVTTFKSLNKAPSYLKNLLTPESAIRAGKFGLGNVAFGQASQFVANKFNPGTLSGTQMETDQEAHGALGQIFKPDPGVSSAITNMVGDLFLGASGGVLPSTLKGTAGAIMLPTTLTYLANPDDPLDAITNGVIFGALHGASSYKNPGFNDVKALGGNKYQAPNIKAFEEAVNNASYASLSHYVPNLMPALKQGEKIPAMAHSPELVQQARDAAIENVWKRFFFGKTTPTNVQDKTLGDFKAFSQNLESGIESAQVPELKGLERLSMSARRSRSRLVKEKDAALEEQFGKGYTERKNSIVDEFDGDGMDLQTALNEVKRITVASRQLYKGGLSKEMRDKADIDDLLSFSKSNIQGRFNEQERFMNPPIAKQAVDSIDESFMSNSFNNDGAPASGNYPNGDIALTGAALKMNKGNSDYFFDQKKAGNASPNILLVDRTDTAPLWSMRNKLLDEADIKAKNYAPDENPENALQAFGVVKNPKTGAKELIPLGWVASDFRLNLATGKGHTAFNQHEQAKLYVETNGAKGFRPIDLNKDQLATAMKKNGISVLVANLDSSRATAATIESKNPFIPLTVKDSNWEYSKNLGDRMRSQGDTSPISMNIAKVNSALGAKQKSEAIAQMRKNIVHPASEYIPKVVVPQTPRNEKIVVPQKIAQSLVKDIEDVIDTSSPASLKQGFLEKFGIVLQDSQAEAIFRQKGDLTMLDGLNILIEAVNSGEASLATKLKIDFTNTYLGSGALQASGAGNAVLDMPLLGKMKKPPVTGVEEHILPSTAPIQKQMTLDEALPAETPTAQKTAEISAPQRVLEKELPEITPPVISDPLTERITATAQAEMPSIDVSKEPGVVTTRTLSAKERENLYSSKNNKDDIVSHLAKDFIAEAESAIDNAPGGYIQDAKKSHRAALSYIKEIIQSDLTRKRVPQKTIDQVQQYVQDKMELKSDIILNERPVELRESDGTGPIFEKSSLLVKQPTVKSNDFIETIDNNLSLKDDSVPYYTGKAFKEVFSKWYGKDWRNSIELRRWLSTMTDEGDSFWNKYFSSETNSSGREIKQPKDVINNRALGQRSMAGTAIEDRKKLLKSNPTEEGGGMTTNEKAVLGIETPEMANGMRVTPWYQEDNMVGNLTQGENLMASISSDLPMNRVGAVRVVKGIIFGQGEKNPGLYQMMSSSQRKSLPYANLDKLEKEAMAADFKDALKKSKDLQAIEEAKALLPELKAKVDRLQQEINNPDPENPLPAWQTPAMLSDELKKILEKANKYNDLISSQKKNDGGGGPGYHDGAGGFGDWFKQKASSLGHSIGNTVSNTLSSFIKPKQTVFVNQNTPKQEPQTTQLTFNQQPKKEEPKPVVKKEGQSTLRLEPRPQPIKGYKGPREDYPNISSAMEQVPKPAQPPVPVKMPQKQQEPQRTGNVDIQRYVPQDYVQPLMETAERYGVDPRNIAAMVQQESSWNPGARASTTSATGFGQLTIAALQDIERGYRKIDPTDPVDNLDGTVWYLTRFIGPQIGSNDFFEQIKAYYMGAGAYNNRFAPQWAKRLAEAEAHADKVRGYLYD
jgi:hypothetical protein